MDKGDRLKKVAEMRLREAQSEVGRLQAEINHCISKQEEIERCIHKERAEVQHRPHLLVNLENFVEASGKEKKRLYDLQKTLERNMEPLREKLEEAFREYKTFEKLLEQERLEDYKKLQKREQKKMDEDAVQMQYRKRVQLQGK